MNDIAAARLQQPRLAETCKLAAAQDAEIATALLAIAVWPKRSGFERVAPVSDRNDRNQTTSAARIQALAMLVSGFQPAADSIRQPDCLCDLV